MNRDHVPSPRASAHGSSSHGSSLCDRTDLPGLRELDRKRSLELLSRAAVGRVVYTVHALPAVLPVSFRLGPGGVLVSAPADSELARAVDGAVIAFEADEVDGRDGSGWFVTVLGRAQVRPAGTATDPDATVRIRIRPELVIGRCLV
ncbi:pyridoxamine 5'-phosphate oxidase family protein [Kitasatospora sp. NPDC056783]|uniref:pyridoxamine 5'-phosphate oxidase family protein n=1 Tax=Kitasatospora sp. NPDC056783 TaxID=3345943 RepID=UPI0036BAB881